MAIVATDWTIDRTTKVIAYTGDDHDEAAPSYATVLEFHRWLQDLADDQYAIAASDDELDITNTDPSRRSTDNIITLINSYELNAAAPEHLYDGSIIQGVVGVDQIIWDGVVNFGNATVQIQLIQDGGVVVDDWWNYRDGGVSDAASATLLTDATKSWTPDEWIGYQIKNTTDGSWGIITDNDATTITVAELVEGTANTWAISDAYLVGGGVNNDSGAGISHRFMVKIHDFVADGGDIDGRRLIGTSRKFGYTYSEFSINGSTRGNNVLALSESSDLNNATGVETVETWTTITNTEGYVHIDVDNDGVTDEYFYSEWDKAAYSINQFYERMKWLTREGSVETMYGIDGELFRGITHQIAISSPTGTFVEPEEVSWGTGATAGTGQLLAIDSVTAGTTMWIQLLTGVTPTGTITGVSTATATAGAITDRSGTISTPFVGASTGSALIGAYGVGVEYADLTSADKLTALDNVVYTPPNNVQNTVAGVVIGEDYILVAPWDGAATDDNGDPAITKDQLSLDTALTTDNITEVEITETIPADTPGSGTIRVTDNDGYERRLVYTGWENGTPNQFTGITAQGDSQEDFAGVNANATNDVYITYLDLLATATSESFTSVQSGTRQLVVVVRDGGTINATPIKQFISEWSQTTSPQTLNVIRTSDL